MGVVRSCNPGNIMVTLAVSAGEYLEYRVPSADATVQYVLAPEAGASLFDNASCPPSCTRRWPAAGQAPAPGEQTHALSMEFVGNGRLAYEVDRKSRTGAVLEVVKRCTFENDGAADDYYEPLTIVVS